MLADRASLHYLWKTQEKPSFLLHGKGMKYLGFFLIAMAILYTTNFAQAETDNQFTGLEFLQWSEDKQSFYFQVAVTMAGVVATQTTPEISQCIDRWYLQNPTTQKQLHKQWIEVMRKQSQYHPSALILALIQKECGSF